MDGQRSSCLAGQHMSVQGEGVAAIILPEEMEEDRAASLQRIVSRSTECKCCWYCERGEALSLL